MTSLVKKLLKGSHNVDLMKKEINELVSMVVGFAHLSRYANEKKDTIVSSAIFTWEIRMYFQDGTRRFSIEGFVISNTKIVNYKNSYRYTEEKILPTLKGAHIQVAYEHLYLFLKAMIRLFPDLEERWSYLIKASKVRI
jgi:hypothetical protein